MSDKNGIVGLREIMAEFGVSDQTIYNYVNKGMPEAGHDKYNLLECYRWRTKKLEGALKEAQSTSKCKLDEEKIRQTAADADIKEIKAAQLRGELIPLDAFERTVGAVFGFVRQGFLTIPGRTASQLEGIDRHEIKERLARAVRETLAGLSEEEAFDRAIRDTRTAIGDFLRVQPGTGKKPAASNTKGVKKPRAASGGKRKPVGGTKSRAKKRNKQPPRPVAH